MDRSKLNWKGFISAILLYALATGCSNGNPAGSSSTVQKNSVAVMKAASRQITSGTAIDIPVQGGDLHIQVALLNIEKFEIEENSGFDGEQEGEHQDGDHDDDNGNDDTIETELEDIEVTGPFDIDVSNGEIFLDSVAVYSGTFKKVEFNFVVNSNSPFNGNTIHISGEFRPTNAASIPFTLQSQFSENIQGRIAGDGIIVSENTIVPIVVTFDLAGWFNGVDFSSAEVVNSEIRIDSTSNTALLTVFENNLGQHVDVEEDND